MRYIHGTLLEGLYPTSVSEKKYVNIRLSAYIVVPKGNVIKLRKI